jgi:hypothetical protein
MNDQRKSGSSQKVGNQRPTVPVEHLFQRIGYLVVENEALMRELDSASSRIEAMGEELHQVEGEAEALRGQVAALRVALGRKDEGLAALTKATVGEGVAEEAPMEKVVEIYDASRSADPPRAVSDAAPAGL